MCGIAGIVAPNAKRYRESLERMVSRLAHRGPDGSGTRYFENCALGHRRLSIVDLATGDQPMLSVAGDAAVTFNGEIYGYREIRSFLPDYPFRTSSDTEVLIALHRRHGREFVKRLPGMFAFALWDETAQELLCARDRFGEKPLYYAFGENGEFLFASEIKALLASALVRPLLDRDALAHYLKYLYVHPHRTIYRNVQTLPPAHAMRYSNGRLSVERYWRLPEATERVDLAEALEQFKTLLDRAVAKQLVADVPVGAFLSGGLDSSTIVAIAARHEAKLKTFSFGFEDSVSELPHAREVAKRYRTEHIELEDAQTDIGNLLLAMQEVYDEPFADSSNIPTYLIAKLARVHVKAVLTGDGGDELLAGYTYWYRPLLMMQDVRRSPRGEHLLSLASLAFARLLGRRLSPAYLHGALGTSYALRHKSIVGAHLRQQEYFADRELARLGLSCATPLLDARLARQSDTIDDALRADLERYMPGDILVKIDRASMANALELRAPFLDVDFASFCASLPYRLKIDSAGDKRILRRAYEESWPPTVRTREKQGFGAPVAEWLGRPSVKALKEAYLGNRRRTIFSLLPYDEVGRYLNGNDYRTWALLVLALWAERHPFNL